MATVPAVAAVAVAVAAAVSVLAAALTFVVRVLSWLAVDMEDFLSDE